MFIVFKLNDKFGELAKIILEFIKKLSKKLKRAFEYIENNQIPEINNLIELLFRTTFIGRIKEYSESMNEQKKQNKTQQHQMVRKTSVPKYTKN